MTRHSYRVVDEKAKEIVAEVLTAHGFKVTWEGQSGIGVRRGRGWSERRVKLGLELGDYGSGCVVRVEENTRGGVDELISEIFCALREKAQARIVTSSGMSGYGVTDGASGLAAGIGGAQSVGRGVASTSGEAFWGGAGYWELLARLV